MATFLFLSIELPIQNRNVLDKVYVLKMYYYY